MPHLIYNQENRKYWSGNQWTKRLASAQEYPTQSAAEKVRQALAHRQSGAPGRLRIVHRKHIDAHPTHQSGAPEE